MKSLLRVLLALLLAVGAMWPPISVLAAVPNRAGDVYAEGMSKLRRGELEGAVQALAKLPEDHPRFVEAMVQAGQVLAESARRPELALPLLERAYRKAPDRQEVAYSWARAQLLARVNLSVPFQPRPHPAAVPEEFRWIADGPHFPDPSKEYSRAQLESDLDYLETMVANGYSYAERRRVDWRGAFDAVRASLRDATPIDTFKFRLRRAMTVFGDPHSAIRSPPTAALPSGALPFLPVADTGARVLALKPDRSAFVDAECPYVTALDGRPIADWLRVAGYDVPQSSSQLRWRTTVGALARVNYLRGELGLPVQPQLRITLAAADGLRTNTLELPVAKQFKGSAVLPHNPTNRVIDGIGYLRIEQMAQDRRFINGLNEAMTRFKKTRGLIIDVRNNGGGSQDALRTLMPYFLPPGTSPRVVNAAVYRVPVKFDRAPAEGFLPAYRFLHPVTAPAWKDEERAQIKTFLAGFKPDWQWPSGQFSEWHVMVIRPETNPRAFHYERPLIILGDAGSFSATDNFLGAFKGLPKVTILGGTSGGGSGRMANYTLPNTRLSLTLCQMASFRWSGQLYDGAGVEPDVVVEPRSTDYLAQGGDAALEAALERLGKP